MSAFPILIYFAFLPCFGQEVLRPIVAPEFGKPVIVAAEFVAKPNTYYDQNLVSEPFMLNVVSVDGRRLKEAVLIEYRLETGKKERKGMERTGVLMEFEAYETVYQSAFANPWLKTGEQGMAFTLFHVLHIRPMTKKG